MAYITGQVHSSVLMLNVGLFVDKKQNEKNMSINDNNNNYDKSL